jgi:methylmalonyl-CoA/ethylmalonyl-CoA epimerase
MRSDSIINWKNLGKNDPYYGVLSEEKYKMERLSPEVVNEFFKTGESKLELLGAAEPGSVVARFIEKRGEGLHHIAFETDNLEREVERLKKEGYRFLSEEPLPGADNKRIIFMHPSEANGVLIELCESRSTR